MKTQEKNTRGLYELTYGYSDHSTLFISTKDEVEKFKGQLIFKETSKHEQEDIELSNIRLVTEDQDFIEKFNQYKIEGFNPFEYVCEDDE